MQVAVTPFLCPLELIQGTVCMLPRLSGCTLQLKPQYWLVWSATDNVDAADVVWVREFVARMTGEKREGLWDPFKDQRTALVRFRQRAGQT